MNQRDPIVYKTNDPAVIRLQEIFNAHVFPELYIRCEDNVWLATTEKPSWFIGACDTPTENMNGFKKAEGIGKNPDAAIMDFAQEFKQATEITGHLVISEVLTDDNRLLQQLYKFDGEEIKRADHYYINGKKQPSPEF